MHQTICNRVPKFYQGCERDSNPGLTNIPENRLQRQFTEFLRKLEKITEKYKQVELRKVDPKELLKKFFNPEEKLLEEIEMIMQAVAVSAVKQTCESVLGYFVSKCENHFHSNKNLAEDKMNDAFFFAVNGPSLVIVTV